jgi:hypothetical protein
MSQTACACALPPRLAMGISSVDCVGQQKSQQEISEETHIWPFTPPARHHDTMSLYAPEDKQL